MVRRILLALVVVVAVLAATLAILVASRQNLKFDAPYPPVHATTDSAVVERGRYVVHTLAVCGTCHGDVKQMEALMRGEEIPLSGGHVFDIPPGKIYPPNITPDVETGLGKASDAAIARALRSNVGVDGRALLPFMNKQGMADDDLVAVVSYLRAQPAVRNPVPNHSYTLLGKVVKATVLANPAGPKTPPPPTAPRGATLENGRYLAEVMGDCSSCHTQINMATGEHIGPAYGGATGFDPKDDGSWSPPNITSGGKLGQMTEDAFVARFRAGRAIPRSPMPWQAFQNMHEDDLRALYRFLMTVPPVTNDVGPAFVAKEKKAGS